MTERSAKRLILFAVVVAGALATLDRLGTEGDLPAVRVAIGIWLAAVLLSLLAEGAPQVAGPLAALLLVSSLLTLGPRVLGRVNDLVTPGGSQ